VTILQPLIEPLLRRPFRARARRGAVRKEGEKSGHDVVRETYAKGADKAATEKLWRRALHDGVVAGTALAPKSVTLRTDGLSRVAAKSSAKEALEIAFRPDPTIFDGRFANNGWLQELPKPGSKLTWDNVAIDEPVDGRRLGLANEMVVTLTLDGRSVDAPVWIQPGQADECVTVHLGYGRWRTGRVGFGRGIQCLCAAQLESAVGSGWPRSAEEERTREALLHADAADDGRPQRLSGSVRSKSSARSPSSPRSSARIRRAI